MFEVLSLESRKTKRVMLILLFTAVSLFYIYLCSINALLAVTFAAGATALYTFFKNPDLSFYVFIAMMPFIYCSVFSRLPSMVSALKLEFGIFGLTLLLLLFSRKTSRTGVVFKIFVLVLTVLFTVAWVRSGDYALRNFTMNLAGELPLTSYLIYYVSWTVLSFAPAALIPIFYRDGRGIDKIVRLLTVLTFLIVGYLLAVFLFRVNDKSNFEAIRTELGSWMGMNGNDIANYFILAFPVVLAWAFSKKNRLSLITLFFITAGTLLCFSRTGYFLVLFGLVFYLVLSRKLRWLPVIAAVVAVILLLLPDMFVERALTGLTSGDLNEITSGRVDYVWKPLISELANDPQKLLFGSGRFGITNTDAWMQGRISLYYHAHNIYLDCILDMGVTGLAAILAAFSAMMVYFLRTAVKIKEIMPYYSNLLFGCLTSIVCFLIAGMTGRTFFPNQGNLYLWIIIGLGFAISGHARQIGLNKKRLGDAVAPAGTSDADEALSAEQPD